jgi:hypothetical protein
VQESYGIYKFITSMLRAMHSSKPFSSACIASRKKLTTSSDWRR